MRTAHSSPAAPSCLPSRTLMARTFTFPLLPPPPCRQGHHQQHVRHPRRSTGGGLPFCAVVVVPSKPGEYRGERNAGSRWGESADKASLHPMAGTGREDDDEASQGGHKCCLAFPWSLPLDLPHVTPHFPHFLTPQVIKLISQVIADFANGEISQVCVCEGLITHFHTLIHTTIRLPHA